MAAAWSNLWRQASSQTLVNQVHKQMNNRQSRQVVNYRLQAVKLTVYCAGKHVMVDLTVCMHYSASLGAAPKG